MRRTSRIIIAVLVLVGLIVNVLGARALARRVRECARGIPDEKRDPENHGDHGNALESTDAFRRATPESPERR
jgi:hypothetical protein